MIDIIDAGLQEYSLMLQRQRNEFCNMVDTKKKGLPVEREILFLVEHHPVLTMGKHAHESNLLLPESLLASKGIEVYRIERGGDVTFHGPGQLVAYPLIDLEKHRLGVKDYVDILEEAVIRTIAEYGIKGERVAGASGVWIGKGTAEERKICALGVKCSRFVTMHGLALNVNTDLSYFGLINPCGFVDKGVTSIEREIGRKVEMSEVKVKLSANLVSLIETRQ